MQTSLPLACFLSIIRPPSIQFENSLLQIAPVDKVKCPYVRDVNDVIFQLYTRHNPALPQGLLIDDDERLYASNMDFHVDTVIIFHAFMETPNDGSVLWLREAYTPRGDTNVIVVDAQRLEAGPWYIRAAENTWYIGRIAAQFIDYLVSRGLKLSKTQLVGHSLGAQSAGVAGGALHSGKVSRITGLDAALPLFNKLPLNQRLDPSDADFVDAIHTDAGIFGFKDPIGHVDFFPNGGISPQPGCELEAVIPQQLLLNDCTNIKGYYVFHLCEKYNSENGPSKAANIARILNNIIRIIKKINDMKRVNIKPSESDTEDYEKLLTIERRKETEEGFVTKILTKNLNTKNGGSKLTKKSSADRRHRERRFASLFNSEGNKLFKILEFLVKYKQNIIPVVTVMREISTLVKTSNLELNQMVKEQNQYIGTTATLTPLTYSLEVNSDSKIREFFKKIFGFANGKVTVVT